MVLNVLWIKIFFIKLTNSSKHSYAGKNRYRGTFNARVYTSRTVSCFLAMNMPNPLLWSKTLVFEGFAPFHRRTRPVAETSIGVHLIECFITVGLDILLERFQCTSLGPKVTF